MKCRVERKGFFMENRYIDGSKISKDNKKIINFNGNIIFIAHANSENINSKISFPKMEYGTEEGLIFFYCKSGRFYLDLINGKKVLITKNTVFISRAGLIKSLLKLEELNVVMIYMKKEFFNMYFDCSFNIKNNEYKCLLLKEYESTSFERIINYVEYPKKLQKIFIVSKTLEGLMHISSHFLDITYNGNKMEYIRDYIINNIGEKLTIKSLSEKISISETNFKLKFKEYFGMSSKEYIRNLRLETAKELLLNTSLNIKEIFSKIGIENYQTFYNLFILKYGLPPTKLRIKNQQKISGISAITEKNTDNI